MTAPGTAPPDISVRDNPARKRFEIFVGDELAGVAEYIPLPGKIVATHTEVAPEHEGQGLAAQLVTAMLEQLRAEGRLVQPLCPYVRAFLDRHPEYDDVVDPATPR